MPDIPGERPLYVEFVGLPGAGKTTVLEEVLPRLTALGYRCVFVGRTGARVVGPFPEKAGRSARAASRESAAGRLLFYVSLHLKLWHLATAAYGYVLSVGKFAKRRLRMVRALLRSVSNIRIASEMVRGMHGDMLISSQGVAAYLRQMTVIHGCAPDGRLIGVAKRVGRALGPTRAVVVVFDIDPAMAAARIQQRPRRLGPWDRMELTQRQQALSTQLPRIEQILVSLEEADVIDGVLRIDAAKAPAENAGVVTEFLVAQMTNLGRSQGPGFAGEAADS